MGILEIRKGIPSNMESQVYSRIDKLKKNPEIVNNLASELGIQDSIQNMKLYEIANKWVVAEYPEVFETTSLSISQSSHDSLRPVPLEQ